MTQSDVELAKIKTNLELIQRRHEFMSFNYIGYFPRVTVMSNGEVFINTLDQHIGKVPPVTTVFLVLDKHMEPMPSFTNSLVDIWESNFLVKVVFPKPVSIDMYDVEYFIDLSQKTFIVDREISRETGKIVEKQKVYFKNCDYTDKPVSKRFMPSHYNDFENAKINAVRSALEMWFDRLGWESYQLTRVGR